MPCARRERVVPRTRAGGALAHALRRCENGLLPGRGAPAAPPGRGAPASSGVAPRAVPARSGSRRGGSGAERMPRVRAPPARAPEQPLPPEPARVLPERPARGPGSPRRARSTPDVPRPGEQRWRARGPSRSGGRSGRGLACAVCLERSAELASHGGLDRRGGALDELAELLELCKSDLAVDAEFGSDLVYAWFGSHNSPVWVGLPRTGQTISRGRVSFRAVHFVSIAVQPFLGFRRSACPEDLTHAMLARKRGAGVRHPRIRASHAPTRPAPASTPAHRATRSGIDGHDSQECGPGGTRAATDARSYRFHLTPRGAERSRLPGRGQRLQDAVGLDVDLRAGELGGQAGVLPLLADRERQLVVGHERPDGLASTRRG